ncbi:MAG: riboflavin kinase / adenylyltransferase [Alphaproteobacteria bacterium]|jgi:riboflavin kinase/FMN adenylyltransferase|nr:riboflavin kinase / adenylyltransferase [Alphaproteobacteria bacterium]
MIEPSQPAKSFVVLRDNADEISALRGAVLAIGNFDGVHRGHRAVIGSAIVRAKALKRPAAALTFEPHPVAFLRKEPVFRLTDETAKLRLLATTGLDGAIVLKFDAALAGLTADTFVSRILVDRYALAGAVIGFDFHFGKNRMGSPAFLMSEGAKHGFAVEMLPPLEDEGRPVSSGAIRTALAGGRVVEAAELLGYPWFASGIVIHGEKRGRALGYPTANLKLDPACGLKHGIYAVRVGVDGRRHDGVASFGSRPMFDNGAPLLEVFLFDFDGDLYGKTIDVAFIAWIRHEMKFDSVDDLVRHMDEDSARAREALARSGGAFPVLGKV